MQNIDSNRELITFCLLQNLLKGSALHPLDRICLKEHMSALGERLSTLPHWREVFELTFEDDPMEIPLVHSLRAKILLDKLSL